MKIGYFASLFPYRESFQDPGFARRYPVGGAEAWAYQLAHQMAKLGQAARKNAEKYSWRNVTGRFLKIYEEALKAKR
jgi:glycosyltransferase involved in cell wall biosynthesis